jgi:hypothetical protein
MHNFLKAKLNIETTEMSKVNIKRFYYLKINAEIVNDFIALTENCEILDAPSSNNNSKDYDKAVAIISDLENRYNN